MPERQIGANGAGNGDRVFAIGPMHGGYSIGDVNGRRAVTLQIRPSHPQSEDSGFKTTGLDCCEADEIGNITHGMVV